MQLIRFDKKVINVQQAVKVGFSRNAFDALRKDLGGDWEKHIIMLSNLSNFIVVPKKNSKKYFDIHTQTACYVLAKDDRSEDGFTITAYSKKDLDKQNSELKEGIHFYAERGFCVTGNFKDYNIIYKYLKGKPYSYDFDCGSTSGSFYDINDAVSKAREEKSMHGAVQVKQPQEMDEDDSSETLNQMLDLAEQYAELSSEVEERKAQELGKIGYFDFHAISYDRADRTAYEFLVDPFDQAAFKEGVQVEIEGRDQQRICGEIWSLDLSDEKNLKITILFNKQMDFSNLPVPGWISLSVSTVNKDVQLKAIDKIRYKTAAAEYLENVLGANQPKGFDETKDIHEVTERLRGEKYPPNDSQMNAIDRGIKTKDVYLVVGPPGTGKTTIILEWVKYFVEVEGLRVLISSQNNKAVDNVLARLTGEKKIDMIRIGSETKIQSEITPYMFENKLDDMSRKIDGTTASAISRINQALADWKEYQSSLRKYINYLDEINEAESILKAEIDTTVIPVEKNKWELLKKYNAATKEKQKIAEKMTKCSQDIKNYESKGAFVRKLLQRSNEKNLNRLKELASQTSKSWQYLRELENRYNLLSGDNESRIKELKNSFISKVQPAMLWTTEMRNSFADMSPLNPGFANLFESIHPDKTGLPIKDDHSLLQIIADIQKEVERGEMIRDLVNDWRDLVVNSQNYALNEIVLESVNLVGATCIGVNSQKRFADLHFDITIIDEAGQIQIQNALVPMSVSNKLIMLGDHKQIPPMPDKELLDMCREGENDVNTELLEKSLFEKMLTTLPDTNTMMLDTQYRMPGEIADILSDQFYDKKYKSPGIKRGLTGLLPQISEKPFIIIDTSREKRKDRKEDKTETNGTYNTLEADICGEIIRYINQCSLPIDWNEVGIISAYKEQVGEIKKKIRDTVGGERAGEMAATLTSFQGQERELILYSFTRSSGRPKNKPRIGFLQELRFLNVAMSRCKKTLVMIGDMRFLSECEFQGLDKEGKPLNEKAFSKFIRALLAAVSGGSGEIITYQEFRNRIGD